MAKIRITSFSFAKEKIKMGDKPIPNYTEVMSRIQLMTGCETQQELAGFFGIRQSSVSDAKKRGSIPSDWLITLWRKKGANPDWILTGQGARWLQFVEYDEIMPSKLINKEVRPLEECSSQELFNELVRRSVFGSKIND